MKCQMCAIFSQAFMIIDMINYYLYNIITNLSKPDKTDFSNLVNSL